MKLNSTPNTQTTERIREVAKLRVEGMSWAKIAVKYGYANENTACHGMTCDYPQLWRKEYEKARALYMDDVETEALLTQRQLLRSPDERIKQLSAHSLLNHTRQLRAHKIQISGDRENPVVVVDITNMTESQMAEAYLKSMETKE